MVTGTGDPAFSEVGEREIAGAVTVNVFCAVGFTPSEAVTGPVTAVGLTVMAGDAAKAPVASEVAVTVEEPKVIVTGEETLKLEPETVKLVPLSPEFELRSIVGTGGVTVNVIVGAVLP